MELNMKQIRFEIPAKQSEQINTLSKSQGIFRGRIYQMLFDAGLEKLTKSTNAKQEKLTTE
jgi:hypothetical protein